MIEERLIADRVVRRPSKVAFCIIVDKSQGFSWGFYKIVNLENNDDMVCKKPRIFWRQYIGYIDTVRHPRDYKVKYVVATNGFFIELCQEVVVKSFNKG